MSMHVSIPYHVPCMCPSHVPPVHPQIHATWSGRYPLLLFAQVRRQYIVWPRYGGKLLLPYRDKAEMLVRATRDRKTEQLKMLLLCPDNSNYRLYQPIHYCAITKMSTRGLVVETKTLAKWYGIVGTVRSIQPSLPILFVIVVVNDIDIFMPNYAYN